MRLSAPAKITLRVFAFLVMAAIYLPLLLVIANSFNATTSGAFPIQEFTTKWWVAAMHNEGVREALWTSIKVASVATAISLVLGSMVAFALSRYEFFGKNTVNLLVVLPIALPGIVTGVALNNTFKTVLEPLGIGLGLFSVIVGHATFSIVMVFNNVQARMGRMNRGLEEAAMDMGANVFKTFFQVTFPGFRSAFIAGGLLAFALSFDEIVVTTFTAAPGTETLPIWIFNNMSRPNQAPVVNVIAAVLILASMIPVYLSQRLTGDDKK
ncbi:ABC transporter permease [Paeniglutamicibacter cryotolerans]|uniref:Putative spermidine/putrescine transport system permease protein n=1 Tax=Paeniglutamicibacter cryotolerans TaxID=670079 RepID=A0A839QJ03_9MICC|nr:ABC transporter permease [Paeniglutamicibacter cryotolerans]MBB2995787.1 putative spermidine/putrescine transport system permease protein [Paeniglutamicibacter cryotolerans]